MNDSVILVDLEKYLIFGLLREFSSFLNCSPIVYKRYKLIHELELLGLESMLPTIEPKKMINLISRIEQRL